MAVNARKVVSSKLARRAATVKLPIGKDRPAARRSAPLFRLGWRGCRLAFRRFRRLGCGLHRLLGRWFVGCGFRRSRLLRVRRGRGRFGGRLSGGLGVGRRLRRAGNFRPGLALAQEGDQTAGHRQRRWQIKRDLADVGLAAFGIIDLALPVVGRCFCGVAQDLRGRRAMGIASIPLAQSLPEQS